MCKNGDRLWPGSQREDGSTDFVLLTQHFVAEKFGLSIDLGRAAGLSASMSSLSVDEPTVHQRETERLGEVPVSVECDCGTAHSSPLTDQCASPQT